MARDVIHAPTMANWAEDQRGALLLRAAALFYAAGWLVHTGDHLRRGLGIETAHVLVLGSLAGLLQLLAISSVFLRHRWAPMLAVAVGFPDAIGIFAVHLLPTWSAFSDAFPGAQGTGVTSLSWLAAIVEIASALAFALAGANLLRRTT